MEVFTISVDKQGRVVIPAKLREAAGISPASGILAFEENGQIVLVTREQAWKQIREILRAKLPKGRSLVEELRQMRREDLKLEERKFRAFRKKSA
jgi:AbrB family looped-hinge helix DNA binding protein